MRGGKKKGKRRQQTLDHQKTEGVAVLLFLVACVRSEIKGASTERPEKISWRSTTRVLAWS
jgi:hypothetical protein